MLAIGTPLAKWQNLEACSFVLFALVGRMCLHGGFLHHFCTTVHSSVEKSKKKNTCYVDYRTANAELQQMSCKLRENGGGRANTEGPPEHCPPPQGS